MTLRPLVGILVSVSTPKVRDEKGNFRTFNKKVLNEIGGGGWESMFYFIGV